MRKVHWKILLLQTRKYVILSLSKKHRPEFYERIGGERALMAFIRKHVFSQNSTNDFAPQIFVILCVYAVIVSVYTGVFFSLNFMIARIIICAVMILAYVILERSPLKSAPLSFLTPIVIIALMTGGAIYFKGDFLLFTYTICAAMISLTYLKPKGLALYIIVASSAQAIILAVFNINLLGRSFTMIYNYLYFLVAVALNVIVYIFCKFYSKTLIALTEAKNEANNASLAKGAFLSNMSHEIRTPMNAIIGMTAIGKTAKDIENARYAFSKIEDASMHLLGIINDVLDMSKIESGKFDLSNVDFSFGKMLQRVVNVVSFRVEEKKQSFEMRVAEAIPPVIKGDDQRIAQIITNLLGNAIKFTPNEGRVYLNARFIGEENNLCTIQIEVTDSGIGISQEQQSRLFRSFEQAETNISRKYGGTGLGLSISKSLVELMGGNIWVESELGKGATFAFTFQAERADPAGLEKIADDSPWDSIRILAVDDNSGILGYLKNFAESRGAHCDTALCGMEALRMARNEPYDIFFIDWKMSDIGGMELSKDLKEIYKDRQISVVIMVTSVDCSDIEDAAKKAGVDRFLPKPLFPEAIEDIINEFLNAVHKQIDRAIDARPVFFTDKRILLAEDVEINREILISLLEPTKLKIDCAEDGAKAVRMFCDAPCIYDMILMDVQMPEMDGYEATRAIREMDVTNGKTIPIIAMTADVFREDIKRCMDAGMNGHLGKPLETDKLFETLKKYLS